MIKEDYGEPGASPSSALNSNDMANSTGSSFEHENEGLANESGAAVTLDMVTSMTDINLDQTLVKMKEIDRENVLLKEHLVENNRQIKRQYEMVRSLQIKDKEKVDRFKALVLSLREEIKELQVKAMAQQDKENENERKLTTLENEIAHLQRQRTLNEQRVINVLKHAEVQGVTGLDEIDNLPDISDAVLVTTGIKEKEIENFETSIADKEEILKSLRGELLTVTEQRDQFKTSNEMLLKDMEGLQKQKEQLDMERRQLHEQNVHLNKEKDQLMEFNIASTKKEIEVQRHVVEEKKTKSLNTSGILDDAENLEEMFDQKLKLQQNQEDISRLTVEIETERTDKLELEEKLQLLTTELKELKAQHSLAQERIELLGKEKIKLSQEFEENLTSITYQRQETEKIQQAKVSEDQSALRSQVISLLSEVDELNNRLSAATMALQQKDRRITELTEINSDLKEKFEDQWHQSSSMIQTLQAQLNQQAMVTRQHIEEHAGTKQQYQSLQDNFNRLVTDYKDLLETFESEKSRICHQELSKEQVEEMNKMAAQVFAAEEAINYRDKQLEESKRNCNNKDETIKLLHIQLETYQTDFATERESRTKIAQEKNVFEEDLQKAQDQIRNLTEQLNQKHMQDIQRRVSYTQRPHFTNGERLDLRTPPLHQQQQHQYPLEAFHQSYSEEPHALNLNSNNTYRPQNMQSNLSNYYYRQPQDQNNAAARPAVQFDESNADQYPSLNVHECPKCGQILPDTDSLQLHVSDCLDRQQ